MLAHIRETDGTEQSVSEHCQQTARLCAGFTHAIHAEQLGKLQGLLHDAGKLCTKFEAYIRKESDARRGEIDHSYAGAKYLCELADKTDAAKYGAVSRLIAHTILSHHGLHDWLTLDYADYCEQRLEKADTYAEVTAHLEEIAPEAELLKLLESAANEYTELTTQIKALAKQTSIKKSVQKQCYAFYKGMLERFLQSCLIDADRIDTADFMSNSQTEMHYDIQSLWETMSDTMQKKCDVFAKHQDAISRRRCDISDRCAAFAAHPVKTCRLIVPTGGGKTLSSLRFAIEYCRQHGKHKIIYTAPFMSILEQNSDVFREIVGESFLTEHHSNLLAEIETEEKLHEYELHTETWDTPVIATTMVQLLNSLFSGKSSAVRRMHRLSDAVIIIDEVQSVPLKCVHLFNLAINFLTHICGTTVVLCTATQPTMEQTEFPLLLDEISSMTGDTAHDFDVFRRTQIISEVFPYGHSYEETEAFCAEKFEVHGNLLIIVNTKAAARVLFTKMRERYSDIPVIHLSTNLCPAHRKERIKEMQAYLQNEKPVICVTTQLIEAGVDISFRCVVRSLAGLDNAAQAAGRCNRNGESDVPCPVYLIRLKEESVSRLEDVQTAQKISQRMLDNPQVTDYLSYDAQNLYFQLLYRETESKLSYPLPESQYQTTLLNLLALNHDCFSMSGLPKSMCFSVQAFRTAGGLFEVIDNRTQPILVPYNEDAQDIINELDTQISSERCRELLRKAQKYTVNLYNGQNQKLQESHAVRPLLCGAFALEKNFYDANCGVITAGAEQEVLIY